MSFDVRRGRARCTRPVSALGLWSSYATAVEVDQGLRLLQKHLRHYQLELSH
jgi:hypothetical protein